MSNFMGLLAICAALAGSIFSAVQEVHVLAFHPQEALTQPTSPHICIGHSHEHSHVHSDSAADTVHMDDSMCHCTAPHGTSGLEWSVVTVRAADRDGKSSAAKACISLCDPAQARPLMHETSPDCVTWWYPPRGPAVPALRSVRLQV